MEKSRYLILFIVSILLFACKQEKKELSDNNIADKNIYTVVADTLINDMIIKNPNDDEWTNYSLRNLERNTLVNEIFKLVYNGKLTAHEFFSDSTLSIDDVKAIENDPEFSRDKIAKVQFEEAWYLDTIHYKMVKKVYSIMLAYEVYNLNGEIKGYKPAIKVYFK